ncbi:amidohydrolase family protein [Terriglobus sp.]|uniref:amidohydrolase family protein n=1 Tax=Terriglobus sp. TaxID=1889013 RepID=UPI003B003E52
MKIVALEEHFAFPNVIEAWRSADARAQGPSLASFAQGPTGERLTEFGDARLAAMDAAGIDVQVLSLTTPGVQGLSAGEAVTLATESNDLLANVIRSRPDRFQGFATLPTPSPHAAARELERAVQQLHLQGAMIFGRTGDRNADHADFWPIFEAASAMRVPLYLHPQTPQDGVVHACYAGLDDQVSSLFARPGIGWHYEAGIQIVRLVLAGVFDRFPDLKIITGHWGEVILFYLDRLDMLSGPAKLSGKVSEYLQRHLYVTPSGLFSDRYLRWTLEILGAEHILFSTDYPYQQASRDAVQGLLQHAELSAEDRDNIAWRNWERLCSEVRRNVVL